jgi:hypothetical protein
MPKRSEIKITEKTVRRKPTDKPEPQIKGGKPTLRKFILDQYAPWTETHHKSGRTKANRLLVSFNEFADTRINQLTAWRAEKWKAARKAA